MNSSISARNVVQAVMIAIFIFQMSLAIKKYFSNDTLTTSKTRHITDIMLPDVFLCNKKLIDDIKLEQHGYGIWPNVLLGMVDNSIGYMTWQGRGGLSYESMIKELYHSIDETWQINRQLLDLPLHFTALQGFCRRLKLNLTTFYQDIASKEEIQSL